MIHTITVRDRRISTTNAKLIQGSKGSDGIVLDLDDEWDGLDVTVALGRGDEQVTARWEGEPMNIDVDFRVGYIPIVVTGVSEDRRLITEPSYGFKVVRNGGQPS